MRRHIHATMAGKIPVPKAIIEAWVGEGVQDVLLIYKKDGLTIQAVRDTSLPSDLSSDYKRIPLVELRSIDAPLASNIPPNVKPMFTLEYDRKHALIRINPYTAYCNTCGRTRSLKEIRRDVYICQNCIDKVVDYSSSYVEPSKNEAATMEMKKALLNAYRIGVLDFSYGQDLETLADKQIRLKDAGGFAGYENDRMLYQLEKIGDFVKLYDQYQKYTRFKALSALSSLEESCDDWRRVRDSGEYGVIEGWTMPLYGIYHVTGTKSSGYVVDRRQFPLTQRAVACGQQLGGFVLYYDASSSVVIRHILHRAILDSLRADTPKPAYADSELFDDRIADVMRDIIHDDMRYGAMNYPVYFGEYPPPLQTPDGVVTEYIRLGNGIYLVRSSSNKTMLAISSPISELELTIYADHESYVVNDYWFYRRFQVGLPPVAGIYHMTSEV